MTQTQAKFNGLIKDKEPYFFLHVPKTAGTSFVSILDQLFQATDICPIYYTFEFLGLREAELQDYRLFQGHIYYNVLRKMLGKPFQTLTFVRHPVDISVSLLEEFKRTEKFKLVEERRIFNRQTEDSRLGMYDRNYEIMSLEEFVATDINYQNQQLKRLTENTLYNHFDPKVDPPASTVLTSVDRNDLETARQLLNECIFLGITERFEESMLLLAYQLRIQPIRSIPRMNTSAKRPAKNEISPELIQTIQTTCALDFELYDYACQLFEERFTDMWQDLLNHNSSTPYADEPDKAPVATRPSNEQIYAVLEQRYQANFKELNPPLTSLTYTLDQPLSGDGWYMRENDPTYGYIRWSGPGPSASLDLPLADQTDLAIRLEILNALKKELVESLTLEVNGETVPLTFSYSEGFKTLTHAGVIKAETLQLNPGLATLTLKVEETFDLKSINPGGEDNRVLGFALKKIEVAVAPV